MLYRRDPQRELITPDGSRISELLGRVTTGDPSLSVARIVMPPNQGQPMRRNHFHELLIVVAGSCTIELQQGTVELWPDDLLDLPALTSYAELGGPDGCVAWAICLPAFSAELVEFVD